MQDRYYAHIVHGADYNPDQWIGSREIWEEDMRLMDLAHMNSATVGIFAWSLLEPEDGVFDFSWLDEVMDKLALHGKKAILATPSGARPPWLAQKYPEVLRVEETGLRNEYGVRHNHCLTSPVYREKVRRINRALALRYRTHPALFMWHISNEYSGECHCDLCQAAFRAWLREAYHNDLDALNEKWWNGFWSHRYTAWEQICSPKFRGENHVPALKLAWRRFVTDQHISFFENEAQPLRELTPDIPVTTNFMRFYTAIDYQKFAHHPDIISWDNYPEWSAKDVLGVAVETAFCHDAFRGMKNGEPFYMMESTPSVVNWRAVNKLPAPGMHTLAAVQAVAHGADSVQYFQWRQSRGGHEKFHGAVVDHYGKEDTRVFRETAQRGALLERLDAVVGTRTKSRVAVVCDWENSWAVAAYCGYRKDDRAYFKTCEGWYRAFWERGIPVDVIPMDRDFSGYEIVVAPYLYMLKDGTEDRLTQYVQNGGTLIMTYLSGVVDRDDLCYLGGFPAGKLKEAFGIRCEETDALYDDETAEIVYNGKRYAGEQICELLRLNGAEALGTYQSGFYAGVPAATGHAYGKGTAYYVAFGAQPPFISDFLEPIIRAHALTADIDAALPRGVSVRKRGDLIFVMNFNSGETPLSLRRPYRNILNGQTVVDAILPGYGYLILEDAQRI